MSANYREERKKVALNIETYNALKQFSRYNGLKLRMVLEAMTEVMLTDSSVSQRVVENANIKSSQYGESEVTES